MQWLDTQQSDNDKRYVESEAHDARERWFRMIEAEKEEEKRKQQHEEIRVHQQMREREEAHAREADRERKRGRAHGLRKLDPVPLGRGNALIVLSRSREVAT
jgi:hypothetical protein